MTAAHKPDDKSRLTVKTAAGYGLPMDMIATLVGISESTLRLYYKPEMKAGKAAATFQVAQTLFTRATTGKDLGAAIFWLKAQAGWREKHVLDDPKTKQTLAHLIAMSGLDAPGITLLTQDPGDPDPIEAPAASETKQ